MTKFLRDGVYRYGDNPLDVIDKYIGERPVNRIIASQHKVEFWFDNQYLAGVFNSEDGYSSNLSVIFYKRDTRVFLSKDLITPDLVGKTIKTELGDAITIYSFEVGTDFVTFKHRDYRSDPYITTAPFEGLSSWWIVE